MEGRRGVDRGLTPVLILRGLGLELVWARNKGKGSRVCVWFGFEFVLG